MGIEYELVAGAVRKAKRDHIDAGTGQRQYPVIVLEDGTVYREQSKEMAARIRDGRLNSG